MQDGVEIIHQGQVALIMLSGAFSPALKITDAPCRIIGLRGSGGQSLCVLSLTNDASSMQRDSLAFEFLVFVTSGLTNWRLIRQECMAWGVEEYHLVSALNQTRLTSCSYLQDVQHVQFGALTTINTRFFVAASHGPCDRKQCQRFGAQILSQLMNQTAQLPCQRERFDNNRGNEVKSCQ